MGMYHCSWMGSSYQYTVSQEVCKDQACGLIDANFPGSGSLIALPGKAGQSHILQPDADGLVDSHIVGGAAADRLTGDEIGKIHDLRWRQRQRIGQHDVASFSRSLRL